MFVLLFNLLIGFLWLLIKAIELIVAFFLGIGTPTGKSHTSEELDQMLKDTIGKDKKEANKIINNYNQKEDE